MGKDYVLELFHHTTGDVDVAVIEGAMGLFDGADPETSEGSTDEMARWLEAPVVLVINVHGMARSVAALIKGFSEFDPHLNLAGIIANHAGSDRHKAYLHRSLSSFSLPPLLGVIPREALPSLSRRHLGLVTADPQFLSPTLLQEMGDIIEKHLSIDAIIEIANNTSPLPFSTKSSKDSKTSNPVSLGLAYDRAFHFYYPDNLNELQSRGCNMVQFSPLEDKGLPRNLDGLYIGGGYPEEYAERLAENRSMLKAIREFADCGLPIYAECGGLMYLTQGIETLDGKRYPMVGLLPIWTRMLPRLKSLGYVEITLLMPSLWGKPGSRLRGHEFHYSELIGDPCANGNWHAVYQCLRRRSGEIVHEGFQKGSVLASYLHLHWASQPEAIDSFVVHCGGRS